MPVNTTHDDFDWWLPEWLLTRAFVGGERWVKEGCPAHSSDSEFEVDVRHLALPPLSGHEGDTEAYAQYLEYAHFAPLVSRAHELFSGLLNMVPPLVTAPDAMRPFLDNVTGGDSPLTAQEFLEVALDEVLTTYRAAVLVDYPAVAGGGDGEGALPRDLTRAQVERRGILPTWTLYRAEDVRNWAYQSIRGRRRLTLLVLHEWKTILGDDKFDRPRVEQWRVLELVPPPPEMVSALAPEARVEAGGDGLAYHVEIWRRRAGDANDQDPFEVVDSRFPTRDGRLLSRIPVSLVPGDCLLRPRRPVLRNAVGENRGHLRNSASFEHALLFVGNPQPVVTGYDEDDEDPLTEREGETPRREGEPPAWSFGAARVLTIKNENARASMWSLKGEDVSALRDAMKDKEQRLVVLVGNMLRAESARSNIAERTEEMQRSADHAPIAAIASRVSRAMLRALEEAREWMSSEGELGVAINTDYFTRLLTPQEAIGISDMALRGHLGESDVRDLLRRGGWIRTDRTDEEIDEEISLRGNQSGPGALALLGRGGASSPPSPTPTGDGNTEEA